MSRRRQVVPLLECRFGRDGTEVLDRLRQAKRKTGRLETDDVAKVATDLGIPLSAVHGAACFYADLGFRPIGARHIRVCNGAACFATSGGTHITELKQSLGAGDGDISADGQVSVEPVYCLGYCYGGPAALDGERAYAGADLVSQLTGETDRSDPEIPFKSTVDDPVLLAGLAGSGPEAWSVWPEIITSRSRRTGSDDLRSGDDQRGDGDRRVGGDRCGSSDRPTGSGHHLIGGSDRHGDDIRQRIIDEVLTAGLRGRGGGGFPAARKWEMAAQSPTEGPRYLICNADEGDPGSYVDRLLMERDPHRVLEGIALAAYAARVTNCYVYVRSEYPRARDTLLDAIKTARRAGHLGSDVHGSGVDLDIEVFEGAGSYVAGEETSLIHSMEGLRGEVSARPPFPTDHGLYDRPTVVNNVETLAAVPWIVARGGEAYARLGTGKSRGTKLVCLNERFNRPGVYEVELGIPIRKICEELAGGLRDDHELRALQVGGPLGGFLAPDQLDTALSFEALAEAGAALGHGSLIAIDERFSGRELLAHLWQFAASESCGICSPCRVGTHRGLDIARRIKAGGPSKDSLTEMGHVLDAMGKGSLCAFGSSLPLPVQGLLRAYVEEFALKGAS